MNDSVVLIQFWIICIMRLCGPQAPAEISANPVKLQQSSFDLQFSVGALETGGRERERERDVCLVVVLDGWFRVFKNRSLELYCQYG